MSGTIVVGVDGSPASAEALRWAVGQGKVTGDEVQAVISWLPPTIYDWGPGDIGIDWAEDSRAALEETIKDTLDDDEAAGVQRLVVQGHPAQVLTDAAADANLLVVGSRGHGGFTGMLLGSVSHHVISHAKCPVVVIHSDVANTKK